MLSVVCSQTFPEGRTFRTRHHINFHLYKSRAKLSRTAQQRGLHRIHKNFPPPLSRALKPPLHVKIKTPSDRDIKEAKGNLHSTSQYTSPIALGTAHRLQSYCNVLQR